MTPPRTLSKAPIDAAAPARVETVTFAMGCFWCPDAQFGILPGVVRTRVGYAGGTTPNPTYRQIGDHTECVQIDYDPATLTYEQVLDRIWAGHNPCFGTGIRQYQSAIFYETDAKRKAIEAGRDRMEAQLGKAVKTQILRLTDFTLAEDYHQKYELRCTEGLIEEFRALYPDAADFRNSTAAARVNGYIAGKGTRAQLEAEIGRLGLSDEGMKRLRIYVSK
jgi:peptide-methionine (S)-S-oxide reductase